MKLTLLIIISSLLILGAELLKRKFAISVTFTRRAIHVGTATVAGIAPLFVTKEQIVIVSITFAVVLLIARFYNLFSAIHSVERRTFGEVYLPLGVAITAVIFLPQDVLAFQFGIFIMGISDAVSGLIGEKFGRYTLQVLGNTKTLEGSLSFFVCSLVLTAVFHPVFGYQLLIIPLTLTLVELVLIYGLDNFVLPIVAALLFQIFT